jgi:phospholipid/cholesterol/gamma-HCH transport system ATP-binding protein
MSGGTPTPILEMIRALPEVSASGLAHAPLELRLMPGESVLIDVQDSSQATEFADLCCGLLPLHSGTVRFLGHDWVHVSNEWAAAMRGRIGRVYGEDSWISFLGTDINILLPQLHHTWRPESDLREAAAQLSRSFGLPGLPMARPDTLASIDLARAACVRAFMGQPRLLILNSSELEPIADLVLPLMQVLTAAHDRHAASIWLTRGDAVWTDLYFPSATRFRLTGRGLVAMRAPA